LSECLDAYSSSKNTVDELQSQLKVTKKAKKEACDNAIKILRKMSNNPEEPASCRRGRYEFKVKRKSPAPAKPSWKIAKEVMQKILKQQQIEEIDREMKKVMDQQGKKSYSYSLQMKESSAVDIGYLGEDADDTPSEIAQEEELQRRLEDLDEFNAED
jgi:hypothetical protein